MNNLKSSGLWSNDIYDLDRLIGYYDKLIIINDQPNYFNKLILKKGY